MTAAAVTCGNSPSATLPVEIPDLWQALRELIEQIPPGNVAACGELARELGDVTAALWIAQTLMNQNWWPEAPRHRIVLRDGSPGKWSSGAVVEWSRSLAAEGVETCGNRVDLGRFGGIEFRGPRPLARLREFQQELASRAVLTACQRPPASVAGVDVSYGTRQTAGQLTGVASYVVVDVASRRPIWETTVRGAVRFPYIPGYLAFRELPLLLAVIEAARFAGQMADVIFVDGNGWLHPRSAGIATHLGVTGGFATVGIGKSLLCGRVGRGAMTVGERRPVVHDGAIVGMAIESRPGVKPFYVSPGHQIDLAGATELAARLCASHRLPEPIWFAHAAATRAAADYCR
ncbi:MAG: hypothetical protein EHM42_06165 [Planctomycetaceae bacterium]|nr:MAG: hypothetical protein EHM42_06165 [Planctomycetaceae bacterium]